MESFLVNDKLVGNLLLSFDDMLWTKCCLLVKSICYVGGLIGISVRYNGWISCYGKCLYFFCGIFLFFFASLLVQQ